MNKYQSKALPFLEKTLFVALNVIIIDTVITGYGHWNMIGSYSIKIILWAYCLIVCIPLIILKKKAIVFSNFTIISVFLFGSYLLVQALRGYLNGNDLLILTNDIRAYSWFALAPVSCIVINKYKRIVVLAKVIVFSSIALAVLVLFSFILSNISINGESKLTEFIIEYQISSVSRISKTVIRYSSGSMLYIVPSIIFLYFQNVITAKKIFISVILSSLGLVAIFLSYTRSYYLSTMIVLFIAIIIGFRTYSAKTKNVLTIPIFTIVTTLLLLVFFSIIFNENYLLFSVNRIFPALDLFKFLPSTKNAVQIGSTQEIQNILIQDYLKLTISSDLIRKQTIDEITRLIMINPLFGNGLGSGVMFREAGRVEYFYHDLLQKTGVVGILLFISPIIIMLKKIIINIINKEYSLSMMFYISLFSFLIASYFNPIMNSSIGLCYYSICIGILYNSQIS